MRPIRPLGPASAATIDAASHVSTLAKIVEVLLLSSCCAINVRNITVLVDMGKVTVTVFDDGEGYTIEEVSAMGTGHGDLDRLICLSKVAVETVRNTTHGKIFCSRHCEHTALTIRLTDRAVGTKIAVSNIFGSFYVRRRHISDSESLSDIMHTFQTTSLPFIDISFLLRWGDGARDALSIPSHSSLLDRFASFVNSSTCKQIALTGQQFRLEGCAALSSRESDLQCSYVNLKLNTSLSNTLRSAFKANGVSGLPVGAQRHYDMASSRQTPSFLLLVTSAQATLTPEIERHITEYLLAELSLIDGAEDDERRSALYYRVRSKSAARDVLSTASLFRGDDGVENSSNGSVEDALPSKCASTFSLTVERQRRRSTVEEYFDRILLSAPEPQTYSYPSYSDEPCAESDSCLEESYVEDSYVEPKQALYQHAVNPDDDFVKIKAAHLSASSHVDSVRPSHYKLSKEDLQGMVAVGQSACRFVLGVTRLGSLVCADQHAADERIRLEEYTETIRLSFQRIDAVVSLSSLESIALQESAQAVQVWGFRWTVEGARVGATAGDVSCVLVQVPVVLGVALTPSDFVEFVKFVASNRQLPSSLKKPPSIHRIVASKACRSAIKFGDSLGADGCLSLLHKLSLTDLPFQCAHGRPSLQTIADMSAVHAKRRESTEHHGRYSALHQHTS